jgi:Rieske 2Fe-2S family protein
VREWRGFVFVCLSEDPPAFEAAFDVGIETLDNWPLENLVTGHLLVKEIACNWKIFWENYSECLHCPGIHPSLCETVPVYKRGYMAENEAPDWTPAAAAAHGTLGPGKETWSVDGGLCGPAFAGLTAAQRAAGHTFVTMLPTMYIVAHADYVRVVSMRPLGPERTELTARWLFEPATLAAPGFDFDNVVNFAATVMAEDGDACEMNQRGLRSDRFVHGTLMPQEFEVFRFQDWVRRQMDALVAG